MISELLTYCCFQDCSLVRWRAFIIQKCQWWNASWMAFWRFRFLFLVFFLFRSLWKIGGIQLLTFGRGWSLPLCRMAFLTVPTPTMHSKIVGVVCYDFFRFELVPVLGHFSARLCMSNWGLSLLGLLISPAIIILCGQRDRSTWWNQLMNRSDNVIEFKKKKTVWNSTRAREIWKNRLGRIVD